MKRRTFVLTTASVGTTVLAGCSGGGDSTAGGDGADGGSTETGSFRLLVSDQPAAIEDFESLEVTLSSARVFRAGDDEELTPAAADGTVTSSPASDTAGDETDDGDDDSSDGFVAFELDGVTVDLTQVVGDRAVSVLEGELDAGRYSGIELSVAGTEAVVDGETVDVMVPSNRLRIIKPFEVGADEELSFVFDINVVQKGPTGGYNLLPVVGRSGVSGEDVEVEEVGSEVETPAGTDVTAEATDDGG